MDEALEDLIDRNNTDELDNFLYELTAWDIVQNFTAIAFTTVGLISDIIIIYMIARNARMRSKTNLLLMNFIINDAFYLVCNVHLWAAILEIFGSRLHYSLASNCVLEYTDIGFQANESIFLLFLVSNTLIKSKRIEIKTLLIVVYSIIAVNFILNQIFCHFNMFPLLDLLLFLVILLNFAVVLFKEINNCYKKWYKKDPLSERTMFRLNFGRIYVACWLLTFFLYMIAGMRLIYHYTAYILAQNTYMIGFYVLLYIVKYDKNFKICFLNLIRNRGAGDYEVDDTITFADDLSEDSRDGNQGNMNFNAMENAVRSQSNDNNTIQVP